MLVVLFAAAHVHAGQLWVKVDSVTDHAVYFSLDQTFSDQKVNDKYYGDKPEFFKLENGKIKRKQGQELQAAKDRLSWIRESSAYTVLSNTQNEVFIEKLEDPTAEDDRLSEKTIYTAPKYLKLVDGLVVQKTKEERAIADLGKYRTTDAEGVWVEMTPAEKAVVDANDKESIAEGFAKSVAIASLMELANETFGNTSKKITEQDLIDRIKSKL